MNDLKKALENVMQRDIGRYESAEHEFSAEFERKMSALSKRAARPRGMRIGRVFAAVAAAAALFAVGTFAGASAEGFNVARTTREGLPSRLFTATDTAGCPKTVETVYALGGFADKPFSVSASEDETRVHSEYSPAPVEELRRDELYFIKTVHLWQDTKERFTFQYADMEYVSRKQLTVNGGQAYFITRERYYGTEAFLFWESGEYIFTLSGCFSEERALELAGSLEVFDGEIPFSNDGEV